MFIRSWLACIFLVATPTLALSQDLPQVHLKVKVIGSTKTASGLVFRTSQSNLVGSIVVASKESSKIALSVLNLSFFTYRDKVGLKPLNGVAPCHVAQFTYGDTRVDVYRKDGSLDAEDSATLKNQVLEAHVSPAVIAGCTIGPSRTLAHGEVARWTKLPAFFTDHIPTSVATDWLVLVDGTVKNFQPGIGRRFFDPGYGNCSFDLAEDDSSREIHAVFFRDPRNRIPGPYEDQVRGNSPCATMQNGNGYSYYTRPKIDPATQRVWYYILY